MSVTTFDEPLDKARADRHEIYARIADAIRKGEFVEGARLPVERDLAQIHRANRRTVREALAQLEADGLVVRKKGSGNYVRTSLGPGVINAPMTSPTDIFEMRLMIEPRICFLVVARATEEDLLKARTHLDRMEASDDPDEVRQAGYAFYQELARATRNPLLERMYRLLVEARAQAGWGSLAMLNGTTELRSLRKVLNRKIYAALTARDAATAAQLSKEHLTAQIHMLMTTDHAGAV